MIFVRINLSAVLLKYGGVKIFGVLFYVVCFGATPIDAEGLFLAQH